ADELTAAAPLATLTEALRSGVRPVVLASDMEELATAACRGHDVVSHLARLLVARARQQPLLVWLDDLHWADRRTLAAGRTRPVRRAPQPVLWTVSRRLLTTGSGSGAAAAFDRLARDGATRLILDPLDPESVLALARELAVGDPDADLGACLEAAGGTPAYVVELVRGLAAEPRLTA